MLAWPELIIAYDDKSDCAAAACSFCGHQMPAKFEESAASVERINVLVSEFEAHVLLAHPTVSPRVVPRRLWEGQVRTL